MPQVHKHPTGLADLFRVLATQTPEQAQSNLPGLLDLLGLELKSPELLLQQEEQSENSFESFKPVTPANSIPEKRHKLKSIELPGADENSRLLRIFLLYVNEDEKYVEKLTSLLQATQSEFQYFIWHPNQNLPSNNDLQIEMANEIDLSDIVLFLTSDPDSAKGFSQGEYDVILKHSIPIIPVWIKTHKSTRLPTPNNGTKRFDWMFAEKAIEDLDGEALYEFVQTITYAIDGIGRDLLQPPDITDAPQIPQTSTYQPEPYIGLNSNQLRAYLTRHLSHDKPGFELNLTELEQRFVTQTPLFPLPYQPERSFSHGFRIVIDMSATLRLFEQDIRLFITALRKLLPNESIEIFTAVYTGDTLLVQNQKGQWSLPHSQTNILIFSLFGFDYNWEGFAAAQLKQWQAWLEPLHRQGISVNAITPFATHFWQASLLNWISAIPWHSHSYTAPPQKVYTAQFDFVESEDQQAFLSWCAHMDQSVLMLAQLLSMTVTCSLTLLRYLKTQLCANASICHELQLFQCFQFDYLSSDNIKLNSQHASWLREVFRELTPQKYIQAKKIIESWREQQQASVLLLSEEKWLHPHLLEAQDYQQAEQLALQMLSAMEQDPNQIDSLGSWLVRARKAMPNAIKHQRYMDNCYIKSQLRRGNIVDQDSINRPHNRWLMADNNTAKISFEWAGKELTAWKRKGTGNDLPHLKDNLVDLFIRVGEPARLVIDQKSLFRKDRQLNIELVENIPAKVTQLSDNFPVTIRNIEGHQFLLFPNVNVFVFCNTEDAGYAHAFADMWRLTNVNCVVMCNQFWHETPLQLASLQEAFPDALFIGLIDKIFLNAPTSYLFGFKTDLEFFSYFLFTSEKYSEFKSEHEQGFLNILGDPKDRILMPHESLDDLSDEERNQFLVEFALQIEQKINADLRQPQHNSTIIEVRDALGQGKPLAGEFIEILEKGDDHPPELLLDYEGVKVLITASEMGLKPVPDLNAFRSGDPLFIPVTESAPDEDPQFYGSIRLAQLGLPSVIKWFKDSPRGTTVSGNILPGAAYSLARTDDAIFVELEVLVAEMSHHDRFSDNFPPDSGGDSDSDFKILSIDAKTGYVRVGQKQLSSFFQNQLKRFLDEQSHFEASVLQEYADGVDVQFEEDLSGFIPNTELFWGATESLGWTMQTLLTGRSGIKVKCIDHGEYSLPTLSAKIDPSFKDVAQQFTSAQIIHLEDMLTSQGDSLYSLYRNILVEIPIENIPFRYRATPELLQEFEMSPPVEEFEIAHIDEQRELIELSCFEQARQDMDKVRDFLEPGTVVFAKVLSKMNNDVLLELIDIGPSPAGIASIAKNNQIFTIGNMVRGTVAGFDEELLLVNITDLQRND